MALALPHHVNVSTVVAGYDAVTGPELFQIEPSGESWVRVYAFFDVVIIQSSQGYHGVAFGKGKQAAQSELEKANVRLLWLSRSSQL